MKRYGFTLLELMMAAAVITVALIGLLGVFSGCYNLSETTRNLNLAINGARQKMEEIRAHNFNDIHVFYNQTANSHFEVAGLADADSEGSIVVDNSTPTLLEITVTVAWRQTGGRIFGEDDGSGGGTALNGADDGAEDVNGNGILDSPAQIVALMTE